MLVHNRIHFKIEIFEQITKKLILIIEWII